MADKCVICEESVGKLFLDKIDGTIVKVKKEKGNENFLVCSDCQKEHKEKLKEKVSEKA